MRSNDELEDFQERLAALSGLWQSMEVRAMAFLVEGEWRNALTRTRLLNRAPETIQHLPLRQVAERVLTVQEVLSSSMVHEFLNNFSEGYLDLDGQRITYLEERGESKPDPYRTSFSFQAAPESATPYWAGWTLAQVPRWPALVLDGSGNSYSDILRPLSRRERDLDAAIHAGDEPHDGIDGNAQYVIGLRHRGSGDRSALFKVEAPLESYFDKTQCRLHEGTLHIGVRVGSRSVAERLRIGCVGTRDDILTRSDTIAPELKDWTVDGGEFVAKLAIPEPNATTITLLLRIGSQRVERLQISDLGGGKNARFVAYEIVDTNLSVLRNALQNRGDASGLERAIPRLLFLLGFQSIQLGPEKLLSDGADAIAFNPYDNTAVVVECTTGSIDSNGKLGKLHGRAAAIASLIPEIETLAVLATSAPRDVLSPAELEQAAKARIVILAYEDLEELTRIASGPASVNKVVEFFRTRIPTLPRSEVLSPPKRLGR